VHSSSSPVKPINVGVPPAADVMFPVAKQISSPSTSMAHGGEAFPFHSKLRLGTVVTLIWIVTPRLVKAFMATLTFLQNVRVLCTKCTDFYDSICTSERKVICITETWLNV
jgi:hypothetical protein